MSKHELFYFPYGYFEGGQTPLLKMAALYFDRLHLLDPEKATSGTVGISDPEVAGNVQLLEQKKILNRVAPEEVIGKYEAAIAAAVRADMADPEFLKFCAQSGKSHWTLALAKIPKEIREDPRFKPSDKAMQRFMGELPRAVAKEAGQYSEMYAEAMAPLYREQFVYDEYRESIDRKIEYRYADYPVAVGESIMVNHALFAALLYTGATPITDDDFHHRVLALKISRLGRNTELGRALGDTQRGDQIRHHLLAARTLRDAQLDLPVMNPNQPMDRILNYREKRKDALKAARETLAWLAREIREEPWTDEFATEIHRGVIPKRVTPLLEECEKARNDWLKYTGMAIAAAAATAELIISPVPFLSVPAFIALGAIAGDHVIPGLDEILSARGRRLRAGRNGLHYLVRYKPVKAN